MLGNLSRVLEEIGWRKHDCHEGLPRDGEYHGLKWGAGAISLEESIFLSGLIWVTRPDVVIELGTANGASACVIGATLKDMGSGQFTTVDLRAIPSPPAVALAREHELQIQWVTETNSLVFLERYEVDPEKRYFIFSDTDIPIRPIEVRGVLSKFPLGTVIAVHDTADKHPLGPMHLKSQIDEPCVELPSPRGITVLVKTQETVRERLPRKSAKSEER